MPKNYRSWTEKVYRYSFSQIVEVLLYVTNKPTSSLAFRNWSDNSVSGSCITGKKVSQPSKCSGLLQLAEKMYSLCLSYCPQSRKFRGKWRKITIRAENFRWVQSFTTSYSKCLIFSLCLVVELSVASTSSSPVYSQQYDAPQQTCPSHAWIISWSVDCTRSSVGQHHKLIPFVIGFNKVSLPTAHHKLLTLGLEVTQNNIAWVCGEVLGHCDVPQLHQRSVSACWIFLKAKDPSGTVRIFQTTRCLFPSDRNRRHNPGLSS